MFSVTTYKLEDDDFFWHLNTGKYITENHTVPDKDIFGYSTENTEWIPFEWGADVLIYNIYNAAGMNGVFIFRSIVFALFYFILFRLLSRLKVNVFITVLLYFVLLIGIFDRLSPRPHIFTYMLLAVLIYLFFTYRYISREKYLKRLYSLPVIFLIWGNLHLGVITGLLIFLIFITSEFIDSKRTGIQKNDAALIKKNLKVLLLLFAASAAVLLINPHGINTYTYAYSHTQMKMLESIAEWISPFSDKLQTTFVISVYKYLLYAGTIIFIYAYKKKDWYFALLILFFAVYSVRALRFTVDYEIITLPLLAVSLSYFLNEYSRNKFIYYVKNFTNNKIAISVISIALIYLGVQFQSDEFYIKLKYNREAGFGISGRYFPQGLYKFMAENNITGNPFNNFDTGGYFSWLFPGKKIFIDSRNLNDELFNEYYSILYKQPGFQDKLNKYNIEYVIFFDPKLSRYPNIMQQQLPDYLFSRPEWHLVYWDDLSLLFVKDSEQNRDLIDKFQFKVFNPFTAVFNRKKFENDFLNNLATGNVEMKRKSETEPNGYFFLGMSDIIKKIQK